MFYVVNFKLLLMFVVDYGCWYFEFRCLVMLCLDEIVLLLLDDFVCYYGMFMNGECCCKFWVFELLDDIEDVCVVSCLFDELI